MGTTAATAKITASTAHRQVNVEKEEEQPPWDLKVGKMATTATSVTPERDLWQHSNFHYNYVIIQQSVLFLMHSLPTYKVLTNAPNLANPNIIANLLHDATWRLN